MSSRNDLLVFWGTNEIIETTTVPENEKRFSQIKCDKLIEIYGTEACTAGTPKQGKRLSEGASMSYVGE